MAPSNTNNMTIVIESSVLGVSRTITYNISVMTTQTFINYERNKLNAQTQIPAEMMGGLVTFAIVMAIFFFRAHLPFAKKLIRKKNIKVGLRRLA